MFSYLTVGTHGKNKIKKGVVVWEVSPRVNGGQLMSKYIIFSISGGVQLEGRLGKREDEVGCKDVVHYIVHERALDKPLPLVSMVTRLPAHVAILM